MNAVFCSYHSQSQMSNHFKSLTINDLANSIVKPVKNYFKLHLPRRSILEFWEFSIITLCVNIRIHKIKKEKKKLIT